MCQASRTCWRVGAMKEELAGAGTAARVTYMLIMSWSRFSCACVGCMDARSADLVLGGRFCDSGPDCRVIRDCPGTHAHAWVPPAGCAGSTPCLPLHAPPEPTKGTRPPTREQGKPPQPHPGVMLLAPHLVRLCKRLRELHSSGRAAGREGPPIRTAQQHSWRGAWACCSRVAPGCTLEWCGPPGARRCGRTGGEGGRCNRGPPEQQQ